MSGAVVVGFLDGVGVVASSFYGTWVGAVSASFGAFLVDFVDGVD